MCPTAINQIEMWQAETFDPETIDRELGFAEGLGFNTVRIFFSNLVYNGGSCGIQGAFLSVPGAVRQARDPGAADLLDERGKCIDPHLGKQPDAVRGNHNSQWVMTPGADYV